MANKVIDHPATELEIAQRDVHAHEMRVAQQIEMVSAMDEAAALGRELLTVICKAHDLAKHRLRELQVRRKPSPALPCRGRYRALR